MVKDTDEQPDGVTEGKVWEGPEHRSLCPCRVGVCHPPRVDVLTNLGALQTLHFGDFVEVSSCGHGPLITPCPISFSALEGEGWG